MPDCTVLLDMFDNMKYKSLKWKCLENVDTGELLLHLTPLVIDIYSIYEIQDRRKRPLNFWSQI